MIQTFSHTFKFQTPDSINEGNLLENIISIIEEDGNKHYIQYMQYWVTNDSNKKTISTREINIKVDRLYYLEIANISIDNKLRRQHFFSILGKRRFGASNKKMDFYLLNTKLNTKTLSEIYEKTYASKEYDEPCYTEHQANTINSFKSIPFDMGENYIVFLEQINVSKRKKLRKTYVVELNKNAFEHLKNIQFGKKRIDYIFNQIGKIYFKSLDIEKLEVDTEVENIDTFATKKLEKHGFEIEMAARVNENSVFRKLKDKIKEIENVYFDLYNKSYELLKHPENEDTIDLFSVAVIKFGIQTKDIKQFEEITSYFTTIQMLAESGTVGYILTKYDPDFKDIFLYMLESLTTWNNHLTNKDENVRAFNIATIDLHDSLRYLVDICFKFKHEYQCLESEQEQQKEKKEPLVKEDFEGTPITSAIEYFNEIELESEIYDELLELEHEISELPYIYEYNDNLNERLIRFFNGYTRALNPLFEFKDLSYSLMLLGQKLQECQFEENAEMLLILVKGLVSDLLEWKKTVLVEKTASDIHYMNKSFYSNISQIEILIENRDENESDTIEFF